jgi:hypothetical protein
MDVAVPTEGGFVEYFRGLGHGKFAAPSTYLIGDQYLPGPQFNPDPDAPTSYSVPDINGDSFPDILKALPTTQHTKRTECNHSIAEFRHSRRSESVSRDA